MGILNVTPDSFSDGGSYFEFDRAVARGLQMVEEGADIVDVGGESTRPGAEEVPEEEEIRRVLPVVSALSQLKVKVSIDTTKPKVAQEALAAGAFLLNDVTGLRNPAMRRVCVETGCQVCIMHMQGEPRTMQVSPSYENVVKDVKGFLVSSAQRTELAGVARDRIWLDPGIGFGKTPEHNLALLRALPELVAAGYPVLIGVSRKSFIGKVLGSEGVPLPAEERLEGTLALQAAAQLAGAKVIRAHDVWASRRVINMLSAFAG
jgi:dihydropteroate synthase